MRATLILLSALALSHAVTLPAAAPKLLALRGGGGPVTTVATVKPPAEAYFGMAEKGVANAKMPLMKILHQSIMGGCYIGFGGLLSTIVSGTCPGVAASNPGLQKFIFAACFPVNLLLILLSGGQLFTGNSAAVPAALFEGMLDFKDLVKSWSVSYIGNIIGSLIFAWLAQYTGLLHGGAGQMAIATVMKKTSAGFVPTLVKGIMCNWLVCMAVYLAGACSDLGGKMVGIWFPIFTFVSIGLEHSVANMFLLPLGILAGADVTFYQAFVKNLVPVTIGNAIAGALIVGAGYSYAFGKLGGNDKKA